MRFALFLGHHVAERVGVGHVLLHLGEQAILLGLLGQVH